MGPTDLRCFTLDILPLLYEQVFVHQKFCTQTRSLGFNHSIKTHINHSLNYKKLVHCVTKNQNADHLPCKAVVQR